MCVSVSVCEQFSAALCASAGALVVCVRAYACVYMCEGVCECECSIGCAAPTREIKNCA